MADAFLKVLEKGATKGILPSRSQDSVSWFRKTAGKVSSVNTQQQIKMLTPSQAVNKVSVGKMYLFGYDPKLKGTLPYYDNFPLIFPFSRTKQGFMGINLHYLPLRYRAILMDNLYILINNDKYDETTKLRMSYSVLESTSKFKYFRPCVKHYLNSHIRTRFIEINPNEWDIALFLPLQRFSKAKQEEVWKDSINQIKRYR